MANRRHTRTADTYTWLSDTEHEQKTYRMPLLERPNGDRKRKPPPKSKGGLGERRRGLCFALFWTSGASLRCNKKARARRTFVDDARGLSSFAAQACGGLDRSAAAGAVAAGPRRAATAGAGATAQGTAAASKRVEEREKDGGCAGTTRGHLSTLDKNLLPVSDSIGTCTYICRNTKSSHHGDLVLVRWCVGLQGPETTFADSRVSVDKASTANHPSTSSHDEAYQTTPFPSIPAMPLEHVSSEVTGVVGSVERETGRDGTGQDQNPKKKDRARREHKRGKGGQSGWWATKLVHKKKNG